MKRHDVSPRTPTADFLKLARIVELLMETGASEIAIQALLEEKVRRDLAVDEARRREPSLN